MVRNKNEGDESTPEVVGPNDQVKRTRECVHTPDADEGDSPTTGNPGSFVLFSFELPSGADVTQEPFFETR